MTWTAFTHFMTTNAKSIPAGLYAETKRAGLARYIERMQAGRADGVLTFDDLILRCEAAISGEGR